MTGATAFTFVFSVIALFSPSLALSSMIRYVPISIFIMIWVMFFLGNIPSRGNQITLASGTLWSISCCFGLLYLISLLFGFDRGLSPISYLFVLFILVPIIAYILARTRTRKIALGYLSITPFFILGIREFSILTLLFLEPAVGSSTAFILLSLTFVIIFLPCLWYRKWQAVASFFWLLSSFGIIEISRATTIQSYDLSFFVFPLIGLAFLLLAKKVAADNKTARFLLFSPFASFHHWFALC